MANQLHSTGPHRETLPESYVRPESRRPRDANIPVIDLGAHDKSRVISQIGEACRSYGFFQIVNHGVPIELMFAMTAVVLEFFRLPPEEFTPEWPSRPPSFREVVSAYCREVRELGFRLLRLISLSLFLDENYIEKVLGEQEHHMAINYYPQCPKPRLTNGLPAHTDPNAFSGSFSLLVREVMSTCCREVRQLGLRLLWLISSSLGLVEDYIKKVFGQQEQHMTINYLPQCPQPNLTNGLPAHTDPKACSGSFSLLVREVMNTCCREVRQLGLRLLGLISLSLGLEEDYIEKALGEQEQHMAINYYPKCPEPDLTYGLPAHTDPNALTILLPDRKVAGLQVLKDGKWIRVDPHPNSFVINIGDQLQALSNGRYKSVSHRVMVNSEHERMSVASFLCPCSSVVISPAKKLTGDGSTSIYRSFTYDEYYKKFWSRNLDEEHCLELFKSES